MAAGSTKKAQGLIARAHRYVTACGFAVAAVDAPGHSDRPRTERDERLCAVSLGKSRSLSRLTSVAT